MKNFARVFLDSLALAAGLLVTSAGAANATPSLQGMPPELETRFALSALPRHLRDGATVYLLDPAKGYYIARQGTNALSCLVTRTYWYKTEFRDDVYDAGCFDSEGMKNHVRVWLDTAALRADGHSAGEVKQEIARRYAAGEYKSPVRLSFSYMAAPLMRTYTNNVDDTNSNVMTMTYPHVMYYAPGITDADLGPNPPGGVYPQALHVGQFVYVIQRLGSAETAQVADDEHELLEALCRYRDVLCLKDHSAS